MSEEIELKPCPFCGGEAAITKETNVCLGHGSYGDRFHAYCIKCFVCTVSHVTYGQTEAECIRQCTEDWNRRADDEQRESD